MWIVVEIGFWNKCAVCPRGLLGAKNPFSESVKLDIYLIYWDFKVLNYNLNVLKHENAQLAYFQ